MTAGRSHDPSFPKRGLWSNLVLPQLILLPPLISYLKYHAYSPVKPEALSLIAITIGLGAVASSALTLGCPRLRVGTVSLLVVLFSDIQMNWGHELSSLFKVSRTPVRDGLAAIAALVLIYAGVTLIFWLLRRYLSTVLLVFSALCSSQLFSSPPKRSFGEEKENAVRAQPKPPLYHRLFIWYWTSISASVACRRICQRASLNGIGCDRSISITGFVCSAEFIAGSRLHLTHCLGACRTFGVSPLFSTTVIF